MTQALYPWRMCYLATDTNIQPLLVPLLPPWTLHLKHRYGKKFVLHYQKLTFVLLCCVLLFSTVVAFVKQEFPRIIVWSSIPLFSLSAYIEISCLLWLMNDSMSLLRTRSLTYFFKTVRHTIMIFWPINCLLPVESVSGNLDVFSFFSYSWRSVWAKSHFLTGSYWKRR